jgi:hypothetical protein
VTLPPDPECLVRGFLQAGAGELEFFEVEQFVIGNFAAEVAVMDGNANSSRMVSDIVALTANPINWLQFLATDYLHLGVAPNTLNLRIV